jgi:transposase
MSKEKRTAVILLKKSGKKPSVISSTLKMPLRTVYKVLKRQNETGTVQDRPRSGRPVTVTTPTNRERVRKRIKRNDQQSMRGMAQSIGISENSVRRIVKTKLQAQVVKLSKGQTLSEAMMAKRLEKGRRMLKLIAKDCHKSVVFTDEKIFTVERYHNRQNDRQLLMKGAG